MSKTTIDGSTFSTVPTSKKNAADSAEAAHGKLVIGSLDEPSLFVEAQFNQKEIEITRSATWAKPPEANKSNSKSKTGVNLEFTGAEGRTTSLDLLFDGYEEGAGAPRCVDVADAVKRLEKLASVRNPGRNEEEFKRPHRCLVVWGDVLKSGAQLDERGFKCVIESLTVKYTMFSAQGKPLRAQCVVKLKEAAEGVGTGSSSGGAKRGR